MRHARSVLSSAVALALAAALWIPAVHLLFAPRGADAADRPASPRARALLERQLRYWDDGEMDTGELSALRRSNPEWDFMSRTFVVLSLANLSLVEPEERERYVVVMDRIIDDTLRAEAEGGTEHYLMSYWRRAPFEDPEARSLFVDGEVALMIGARLVVEDHEGYRELLRSRVARVVAQMERGPALSGESYPDECWTFCNAMGLAAVRVSDAALDTDHSQLLEAWLDGARRRLVDADTGMLVSEYTWRGEHLDGPEGSSIFLVAHCLQLVDQAFARDQYDRARRHLGVEVLGFAYAREWPASHVGPADIDSGPVIPITGASAGASGMALVGASAFGDDRLLAGLLTSLDFAAFPIEHDGALRYAAGNVVGDSVILYAMVQGPLWQEIRGRVGS